MNRQTSIRLDPRSDAFVERQLREGHFESEDALLRAALRLLEERQAKVEALRQAIAEGEASGPATPFDMEAIIASAREEAGLPPSNAERP